MFVEMTVSDLVTQAFFIAVSLIFHCVRDRAENIKMLRYGFCFQRTFNPMEATDTYLLYIMVKCKTEYVQEGCIWQWISISVWRNQERLHRENSTLIRHEVPVVYLVAMQTKT